LFVVSRDNREAIVDANIQQCFFWSRFRQLILRQNMRMRHEIANQFFANWIERMFYKLAFYDRIKLSRKISQMNDLREFVNTIFFANLMMNAHHDFSFFNSRVVLIMHNDTIKQLNDMILRLLQSEMHTLNVVNSIINKSRDDEMFAEFLRTLKTSFFSFSRLCLKIKAFVMLLRNLYSKKNFCNETRLMITRISRRILKTRILNEELDEEIRLISRIDLFNTKEELSWIVRRKQFSIRFYFAIIVNKTQDQSLNIVNVDLRMSIFFHEQLYVILSRVTNVSRLCVLFSQNKKTKNIVYSKILLK
jgi:ATP-dependent DNA helicase PIF1